MFTILDNLGGTLPLPYYNYIAKDLPTKQESSGVSGPTEFKDIVHPNTLNRPFAWPIVIRSSMVTVDFKIEESL